MDEICEIEGGERLTTHLNIEVIQLQRLCFRWWGIMYRNCRREDTERHQVGNQMRYTAIFPRFRRRCCLFPLAVCVMWSVETADMFTIYFSFAKCLANFFWLFLFIPKWLPFFFCDLCGDKRKSDTRPYTIQHTHAILTGFGEDSTMVQGQVHDDTDC